MKTDLVERMIDTLFVAALVFYATYRVHQGVAWWQAALGVTLGVATYHFAAVMVDRMRERRARRSA